MSAGPVLPAAGAEPLDVVVIRGAATAAGIAVAAKLAKAKTTTLVLWDRKHRKGSNGAGEVTAALQKRTYATGEEERADAVVMGKAFEFFGVGAPKCALLQIGSDKVKQAGDLENSLFKPGEIMKCVNDNHIETLSSFYAAMIYQPWVHAYRASIFSLIPSQADGDWPEDVAMATLTTRRAVKHDSMRLPDGSGWTFGLQMNDDSAAVNADLVYAHMLSLCQAGEYVKHQFSGHVLPMTAGQKN
mmetsp:Transcript_41713/g.110174  ORF Transcript_41713/g.110174 Transcript_41713/m.110174 type:complete len:244 (-) Transcript_41713:56-787(-)